YYTYRERRLLKLLRYPAPKCLTKWPFATVFAVKGQMAEFACFFLFSSDILPIRYAAYCKYRQGHLAQPEAEPNCSRLPPQDASIAYFCLYRSRYSNSAEPHLDFRPTNHAGRNHDEARRSPIQGRVHVC